VPFPGQNHFRNGFIVDEGDAKLKLEDTDEVHLALTLLGHEMIEIAKGIFDASSKHDPEDLAPHYNESWEIKHVYRRLVRGIQVYNSDSTAEWVEFGSHAGGKTRVLRYRVMGRAADVLESGF